jgi:predicted MFS family arabinose efflux permease
LHIAIVPTETVFVSTLVKDVLKGSALMFGLTITTLNAGALVCGAVLSLVRMPFSPRDMLIIGIVVAGVSIMSMGAVRTTWGLWIAAFLYGAAGALLFAHVLTLVQQSTAPNMRGRAFSMMYVAVEVGSVTGLAVAAPTLALFGPRNVFWVMGTLTLITLLPVIVSMASMRSWRRSVSARQD